MIAKGSRVSFTDKYGNDVVGTLLKWTANEELFPGCARVNVPNHPTMGDVNCLVQQTSLTLVK
jgi:hypothetical protein